MKLNRTKLILMSTILTMSMVSLSDMSLADNSRNNFKDESKELNVTRISGKDRYETAVNINRQLFSSDESIKLKYVVLTSGDSFADAISGGLLASEYNVPIVFTSKERLPEITNRYLSNLFINKVYIVGGESSISKNIEDKLGQRLIRLSGQNRYETARMVNLEIKDLNYKYINGDLAAVYNGFNFSDAIAASPFIYKYNKGKETMLPLYPLTKDLMKGSLDGIVEIAFGGKSSVPDYQEKIRFSGRDRYQTAVSIAKGFKTNLNIDINTIIITNGENYSDALASTPLATKNNAAILLTKANKLNSDTKEYIRNNRDIKNIIIVGGENSVSKDVEKELKEIRSL